MKNVFLTLFFLGAVFQAQAQDPQLLDNEWYLQKLVIDNSDIFPPSENIVGVINFSSDVFNLSHSFCEESFAVAINYMGDDMFENGDGGNVLLGTCTEPNVIEFGDNHYSIFHNKNFIANNPFNYTFVQENDVITLTVTNVDGDQGVYINALLGTSQNELGNVVFYPNPVQDEVTIKSLQVLENSTISIFNLSGKRVVFFNETIFTNTKVNVSNLKRGVYFLELTTASGSKRIEKIIKL